MHLQRRPRRAAGAVVLAALFAVGVGAVVAPGAASAPVEPSVTVSAAGYDADTAYPHPAAPAGPAAASMGASAHLSAAAAPLAGARVAGAVRARPATRLGLAIRRSGTMFVVTAVLARASNGARLAGRTVVFWARTGDRGRWQAVRQVRTSAAGVAVARLLVRPLLQVTLRFAGDRAHAPGASVLLVPQPGATAMDQHMVAALASARTAARRAGLTLVLNSGYRTWAKQQRMYDAAVRRYGSARVARRWVLPPQESTHVRGLAADLGTPAAAAWLAVHGARYDLCQAYGDEPWHFEYRPDWVAASGGRCPAPVPVPGEPGPLSPAPHATVVF